MSLSNPRQVNPAKKIIEWSGSKGKFYYFDKERGEKGENVYFEDTIYIVPLDELSTIKGYHDQSNSGIYSNEVKNISKDKLIVKAFKGGLIASGLYSEIKGQLEGGKFAKSVYAAMISGNKENTSLELVKFIIHGSAFGTWIDAKINIDSGDVVSLSPSIEELKKGTTVYFAPIIKKYKKREDILAKCIDMDKQLQEFLNGYFENPEIEEENINVEKSTNSDVNIESNNIYEVSSDDDLPF